jgi:large subunit ribosomal protein L9
MASVKVILQQDVPNLGHAGDVKQVAPGFFRNYLLPRGLAVEASAGNVRALQSNTTVRSSQLARAKEQTDTLARKIQDVTVTIPVKLGEQGRIYGSVTNKDISEALAQQAALTVDRHKIELREPLKAIGVHAVPIKLDHGIETSLRVDLVPEAEPAQT